MVIREMKVLRHVGVGLEAPPNGKAVVITQRIVKTKTDLNTHAHTAEQVTGDFRSFPFGQNLA